MLTPQPVILALERAHWLFAPLISPDTIFSRFQVTERNYPQPYFTDVDALLEEAK